MRGAAWGLHALGATALGFVLSKGLGAVHAACVSAVLAPFLVRMIQQHAVNAPPPFFLQTDLLARPRLWLWQPWFCPSTPCPIARTHARTHTHIHTHTLSLSLTHLHAHTHARTHAHTHTRMHAHTQTHARTHAHTHTRTHIHANAHPPGVCRARRPPRACTSGPLARPRPAAAPQTAGPGRNSDVCGGAGAGVAE
jgi:hypothetical protein